MKLTQKLVLAAACAGTLAFAGNAVADTTHVIVSVEVQSICKFATSLYRFGMGNIDPSTTADIVRTLPISYRCTNGTPASAIQIDGHDSGYTGQLAPGTSTVGTLPALLTWATPATLGNGFGSGVTPISFDLTGTIRAADLQVAQAGPYSSRFAIILTP